jgi:serpin B
MKTVKWVLILSMISGFCWAAAKQEVVQEADIQIVVKGNNEFALALFAKLPQKQGNLFFSPYSISTALAMTYAGARGDTDAQMAEVLGFPTLPGVPSEDYEGVIHPAWKREKLHSAFGKMIENLNARGKKGNYELTVANALWGQRGYGFLKEFLVLIEIHYDGQLNKVDFIRAVETTRRTINQWVEEKTNDKIKNLIPEGVLNSMTRLVLTNAIYFKGNWASQFKEDRTKPAPFTLINGSRINVPMMNQTEQFPYLETVDFQALELPYVDNELSMIIFLPRRFDGLKEFEKTLTTENISNWLSKLRKREVIVSVPKFKMTSQFAMAPVLKSMGMTDAFRPNVADFSGMNGKRDLFISAVIHKAYVDVDEEGTEAAAATGVEMTVTSVPSRMPVFRADHPFLFLIRDNNTGSILFIGRLTNPKP